MQKKIITIFIAGTIGVGIGALLGYGPMLRYKSEGVLNMEMGTSEYKRFTELANDVTSISQFLTVSPPTKLKSEGFDALIKDVAKGEWHKPLPKVSKADAKELPDVVLLMERDRAKEIEKEKEKEKEKEGEGERSSDRGDKKNRKDGAVYLGLRVTHLAHEPVEAMEVALWLGGYFKEVATREAVRELVSSWAAESRQFPARALEQQLKFKFESEQAEARSTSLKKLAASYPDSVGRQLVNVRKDNEKFMSPVAQLVAAESEIIGIKEKAQKLNREIEQHAFAAPFIGQAELFLKQVNSGSEGVNKLTLMLEEYSKKVKTDAEREKLLTIAADLSQITARFLSQAQFIASPSLPSRSERPSPLMYMSLVGLLFALLTAAYCWRDVILKLVKQDDDIKPSLTT
jgi:hypothetical protein